MNNMPGLKKAMFDLLLEVKDTSIKFIIGGYGVYLKVEHVRRMQLRTLFREWPEARSTNDIDLFLRPELLIESAKLKPMSEALAKLGYQAVPTAEKYQFVKPGQEGIEEGIKIDVLTGPQSCFTGTKVKADARRVRPQPSVGIHAHPVEEALTLEEWLRPVVVDGQLSTGAPWHAEVYLPHPYTFLMMKLFAFRDRLEDANKQFGRYHALDLYTILATTTEEEWARALKLRDQRGDEHLVSEAGRLAAQHFAALSHMGMIRLRESQYYRPELQLVEFMSALHELFP